MPHFAIRRAWLSSAAPATPARASKPSPARTITAAATVTYALPQPAPSSRVDASCCQYDKEPLSDAHDRRRRPNWRSGRPYRARPRRTRRHRAGLTRQDARRDKRAALSAAGAEAVAVDFKGVAALTAALRGAECLVSAVIELGRRLGVTQTTAWNHGLEDEAQAQAGDARTRRSQTPVRARRDRRRLCRRATRRRQAWTRRAGQDAVRRRRRDHAGRQAEPPQAAPGRQFLQPLDRGVRPCQPRSCLRRRHRRPALLFCCHRGRLHPRGDDHRLGAAAAQSASFRWVNTALGNIKAAITGTSRSINTKHVPRYLAEFEYRFNRRYDLAAMIPRLTWAATRTPPMPDRLLKLAEVHA